MFESLDLYALCLYHTQSTPSICFSFRLVYSHFLYGTITIHHIFTIISESTQSKASRHHLKGHLSLVVYDFFPFPVKRVFSPCQLVPSSSFISVPCPLQVVRVHASRVRKHLWLPTGRHMSSWCCRTEAEQTRSERSGRKWTSTMHKNLMQPNWGLVVITRLDDIFFFWNSKMNPCSKPCFLKHFENTAVYVALQDKLAQNEKWHLVSGCGGAMTCPSSVGSGLPSARGLRAQVGFSGGRPRTGCFRARWCPRRVSPVAGSRSWRCHTGSDAAWTEALPSCWQSARMVLGAERHLGVCQLPR